MTKLTSPTAGGPPQGLPHRTLTNNSSTGYTSDDDFTEFDPNDTASLLSERLQAWKHACGDLENYVTAIERLQKAHGKEYEKVIKNISAPLREEHHFDPSVNGMRGFFDNVRTNTHGIANLHFETAKSLETQVLPILKGLHGEIKHKNKELTKEANQGSKAVSKARNLSQKAIEQLGHHSAVFDSAGGKVESAQDDPYVLHRQIKHRLYKQVLEENSNRSDLLSVQDNFALFETHVVQTFNQALALFTQIVTNQAERQKAMYADMASKLQNMPPEFEWMNFLHRYGNVMLDPSAPPKKPEDMAFANENHAATKPLIAGTLERKSRAMGGLGGYKSAYYAVTPANYLHQYDDANNQGKHEPSPDLSLYLPDCAVGALSGVKFNVKGKDVSKGKALNALHTSHELQFKAASSSDAEKWWKVISQAAGQSAMTGELPSPASTTASPTTGAAPTNVLTGGTMEKKA